MTEQPPIDRRRLKMWIRLLRLTRGVENELREFLRVNFDTTLPRFDVMAALHRAEGPMKMSEISQKLLVSNGNATAVVDRLEKDGLARRDPSPTDRRVVMVELTRAGRKSFEEMATAHEAEVSRLLSALGHDELDVIRDMVRKLEGPKHDQNG